MNERTKIAAKAPNSRKEKSVSQANKTELSQHVNSPIDHILHLQRTIGNQAVGRLFKSSVIQAKLKIGQPGDKYEQEADRVADMVMKMLEPKVQRQAEKEEELEEEEIIQQKSLSEQIATLVQRQVEPEEEEEQIQAKPIADQITPLIQQQAEDEEEIIQGQPLEEKEELQRQEEEEELQMQAEKEEELQRQPAEEEEELQMQPEEDEETLQTKENSVRAPVVTPKVQANINAMRGGGKPLPKPARTFFEPWFGTDFSQVRVHNDTKAADTALDVKANAFTVGRDVVFGAGQYNPETNRGRKLLAHELTHVVQQRQAPLVSPSPQSIKNGTTTLQRSPPQKKDEFFYLYLRPGPFITRLKKLIKQQNAELYPLVENNPFTGKYIKVKDVMAGQELHVWKLAIEFKQKGMGLISGGGAICPTPIKKKQRGKNIVIHKCKILLNLSALRFPSAAIQKQIPNYQQQLEFIIAENLNHELSHVAIAIDKTLPAGSALTKVYTGYKQMLAVSNSSKLDKKRFAVQDILKELTDLAGVFPKDQTKRDSYVTQMYEQLVEEKYVSQTSTSTFGLTSENRNLASIYGNHISEKIKMRKKKPMSAEWKQDWLREVNNLRRVVLPAFYDAIDTELAGSQGGKKRKNK